MITCLATLSMFDSGLDLHVEGFRLFAVQPAEDGLSTGALAGWIARLRDGILLHRMEQAKVVILHFAQLQEVLRRQRALFTIQIDSEVSDGGFDDHRHAT